MSFDAIRTGGSALRASQAGVDTAGHNVANVNTPGYTRQRITQVATVPTSTGPNTGGMKGTGVTVTDLSRLRSSFADAAWRNQATVTSEASATGEVMGRVSDLLGNLDTGLPVAVNALYTSFAQLAITPGDPSARNGVLNAGQTVANELNTLSQQLHQIGPDSTSKAVDLVTRVNTLTDHVAQLNKAIADATITGQQPNDLLDARDTALDELATLIGGRVGTPDAQGRVDVYIAGEPVVRGTASFPLTTVPTATGPTITFADGRAAQLGGQIKGLVDTATITVPGILAGFDAWAADFINTVNTAHAAGYGTDGGTGRAFFTGTTAGDITVSPTLTAAQVAASASGAPTDGNNALAMSQIRDLRDPSGTNIGDRLRGHFSHVGLVSQQAEIMATSTAQVQQGLEETRLSEHSVSVDEEMVDMIRYQRAYEAAARVVTVGDQMLDTLINRTGRG